MNQEEKLALPLLPTFSGEHPIWCFTSRESLRTALQYMARADYSQIVVRRGDQLTLLTVEGIAGWLRDQADREAVSLTDTTVGQALRFDLPENVLVMPGRRTVADALDAFEHSVQYGQPRLYAIVLTETGQPTEEPRGIVTPWDLQALLQE